MDIFSLSAHLGLDKSGYESGIQEAKSEFSDLGQHLQDVAKKIAGAWVFKEALDGLKELTSAVVGAYAEYEQLAGGVETLFGNAADAVKAYADAAYQTAGMSANEYMSTVTSFAAALVQGAANSASQSTAITQEAADAQYQAVKESYDRQYEAAQDAYNRQYSALQASLNRQYKALQKSLKKQYEAASRNAEDEIEAYSESLDKRLEKLQASQDKEYKRLQKATDRKLALIEKEYQETIKRIDAERAARIGAIDNELAALDKEQAEKDKANRDAERETTKQRLQEAVQWAKTVGERVNAQNKLNDYLEQIRIEDEKDARQARIDELKEQKAQIQDEARAEENAAKDKRDKNSKAVKTEGDAQLDALKKSQQKQLAAMQKSNAAALKNFRRAKQDELKALQESQNDQLEAVSESNAAQLANLKRSQQARLKAMKRGQNAQLKALKASLKEQQKAVAGGVKVTAEAQAAAAEVANMAIQDMADNANKMGTTLESIQNAYQGFAKQNYTMLDNLKLGYGGTKTEMERLLKDAERISGVKYDINNLTDVFNAIHVVQTELGITGTTAAEAAHTISGSWAATKAAWQNLMIAIGRGEGIKEATDNLFNSASNVVTNIIPVIKRLVPTVGTVVVEAGKKIVEKLPELLKLVSPELEKTANQLFDTLPGILEELGKTIQGALEVVQTVWDNTVKPVFDALMTYINETIIPGISTIWATYIKPLRDKLQDFWDNHLKGIFESVGTWLGENLPTTIDAVMPIIMGAVSAFTLLKTALSIGKIVDLASTALSGLGAVLNVLAANPIGAVIIALGTLVGYFIRLYNTNETFRTKVNEVWDTVKTKLSTFVEWFNKNVLPVFDALKTLFTETIPGWWSSFTETMTTVWENLKTGASGAWADIQTAFTTAIEAISPYVEGLKTRLTGLRDFVVNVFKGDWKTAWTAITVAFGNVFGKIVDKVKGPINKVIGFLNGLIDKVESTINTIINGINGALTIDIPSFGKWIDMPDWLGGSKYIGFPGYNWSPGINTVSWGRINKLAEGGIVRNGGHAIVGEEGYPEYLRVVNGQAIVTPMKNAAPAGGDSITFNIYQQPNQDPRTLADTVQRQLVQWEKQRRAAYT